MFPENFDLIAYVLAIYLLTNFFVFLVFANDKRKAKKNMWRTSERKLLTYSLFAPFGAYAAMKLFRHKTSKPRFISVPFFLALHLILIMYIFYNIWK
ncbi:DUF1294 domain-containing protein [Methanoplanus sp. FWC-SCC4]|uniref:DUF1294 domain-containing protein n=1 Tax=Methanochimaera problematica TaxID=2609417 RepID=A0AA97FEX2_9EURY|nr:DUF1294 domain-containing protein [Methanoplanus sp. FWC-SCC4]WOF16176.1 DUF1294 domain-containing protein [Methanoplanus sp. FWC-SCC4]